MKGGREIFLSKEEPEGKGKAGERIMKSMMMMKREKEKGKEREKEKENEDVQRLLHCLQRGLAKDSSPGLKEAKRLQALAGKTRSELCTPKRAPSGTLEAISENNVITPNIGRRKDLQLFSKEVSPGVFYGSPAGKPSNKPPQLLRLLSEIKEDLAEAKDSLPSRSPIWATFPRQAEAFQFADSHGKTEISVFTYEDHITGQRRFLATSYEEFWKRYCSMPPQYRHHYEIIRQDMPCHLYFDLEFDHAANNGLDGEDMVDILLGVLSDVMDDVYGLKYEASWTVELDSSTQVKFSRHLIVHIPKSAFKDNSHVGAFVGEICKRIDKQRDASQNLNKLFALKGSSRADCHAQLFLDQAVYSRNRSFRLPFSSKAGKSSTLMPTRRFRCKDMEEHDTFMNSLIGRLDEHCEKLLTFSDEDRGGGSVEVGYNEVKGVDIMIQELGKFSAPGTCLFPALDVFIESIACIGNVPGRIRNWYWFSEYGIVVYNIMGNRYCEHIGRPHKSNNVMYIVDFRTAGYYQKCHDPDCRGYKSPLRPIPRHTIPPNFPLSTAARFPGVEAVAYGYEMHTMPSVSLTRDTKTHEEELDEESWWEQVVSSVAEIELECTSSIHDNQIMVWPQQELGFDDSNWWKEVEREAIKLEQSLVRSLDLSGAVEYESQQIEGI